MGWLPLRFGPGLVAEDKPTEFSRTYEERGVLD